MSFIPFPFIRLFQGHFRFRLSLIFHIIEAQDRLWPVQADTGTFLFFFSGFPDQFQKFSEDLPGEISSTPVKSKHSTFFAVCNARLYTSSCFAKDSFFSL